MKYNPSTIKTLLVLALASAGAALLCSQASAQTTIAKWTFESVASGLSYAPGAGVSTTNFLADLGTQAGIAAVTGKHSGFGTPTYSSPAGNGSARSFSANGWTNSPGDYYQIAVSTVGFTNIGVSFDQIASATGPGMFFLAYSTNGTDFTQFGNIYLVTNTPSWSASSPGSAAESYNFDLSTITGLANCPTVYIRLVDAAKTNSALSTSSFVGTGGTCRIDNVAVVGTIAGPPQIIVQPPATSVYYGDTANITVSAGGDAPLSYRWYYPNMNTPLSDGGSGYGSGTITGSTNSTLTLTFMSTSQAGNYRVVITNAIGAITSSIAALTVNVRAPIVTNIAALHKLHDANFVLTDTTNLYTVEGIVTTIGDLVSGTTEVESFFVQDGTGGVDVFFRGGFPFPNFGDHVKITAPLLQFNGVLEVAPINGNPAHSIQIFENDPVPAPQYFDFSTLPTPTVMEESLEGRYLVISNVFLDVTNQLDKHLAGNEIINMTNLAGQVFHMVVANNPLLGPPGYTLPCSFASTVTGVMNQSQTSGTVLTNNYSIILSDFSQITAGTVPSVPVSVVNSNGVAQVQFSPFFSLQSSTNVAGPYTTIPGATNPFTIPPTNTVNFYRIVYTNQ